MCIKFLRYIAILIKTALFRNKGIITGAKTGFSIMGQLAYYIKIRKPMYFLHSVIWCKMGKLHQCWLDINNYTCWT